MFNAITAPHLPEALRTKAHERIRTLYGEVTKDWAGFIPRPGQIALIESALNTLLHAKSDDFKPVDGANLGVFEAGTGTGKTLAYSLAAVVASEILDKPVVISTATVALQEQLTNKDLPALAAIVPGLSFELVKGRGRYVCKRKLADALDDGVLQGHADPEDENEADMPAPRTVDQRSIVWIKQVHTALDNGKWDGDRDTMGTLSDDAKWGLIQADAHSCPGPVCESFKDCSFYTARNKSKEARIVVTNHSLVLSALAGESALIDTDALFIFDEAHHLPTIAVEQFASVARIGAAANVLSGLRRATTKAQRLADNKESKVDIVQFAKDLHDVQEKLRRIGDAMVESDLVSEGSPIYRFAHGNLGDELTPESSDIASRLRGVLNVATGVRESLLGDKDSSASISPKERSRRSVAIMELGAAIAKVQDIASLFDAWGTTDKVPLAKWVEFKGGNDQIDFDLCASPMTGAQGLVKGLWRGVSGAVLTSATLRACDSFDYFLRLSGLNRFKATRTATMESPFNYPEQGTLRTPRFKSTPKQPGFSAEFCAALPALLEGFTAGQLVLFTSRRQMDQTYESLPMEFKSVTLIQGSVSRQDLLEEHRRRVKAGKRSIIFGLQSLGEGLDLPGDLCQQVLIDRLPFTPPTSPVDEALTEWLKTQNREAFDELVIPRASMRLAQWVGRAVRTVTDKATITICDVRLTTTRYGREILESLPPFARVV